MCEVDVALSDKLPGIAKLLTVVRRSSPRRSSRQVRNDQHLANLSHLPVGADASLTFFRGERVFLTGSGRGASLGACKASSSRVTLNAEAQEHVWVTLDEALRMPVDPYTATAIRKYRKG
jgi:hypothetical protein